MIVPGGFGVRGTEGKIACVRYCRENQLPYLGICLGFQMAVIELRPHTSAAWHGADRTEFDARHARRRSSTSCPSRRRSRASAATCGWAARTCEVKPRHAGVRSCSTVGDRRSRPQRFRHRYEVDPQYIDTLEQHGLVFSGRHPEQPIMQILELPERRAPVLHRRPVPPGTDQPAAGPGPDVHGPGRRRHPARPPRPAREKISGRWLMPDPQAPA